MPQKYVLINSDGSNAFYDDAVHENVPENAIAISDDDYSKFFNDNGKYIFKNEDNKAVLSELVTKYCYYSNGLSSKIVNDLYIVSDGEALFDKVPTSEELKAAFSGYAAALKEQKLTALDDIYQPQFNELAQSLGLATLASNDDTITSIKSDYTALKAEYSTKREEIING